MKKIIEKFRNGDKITGAELDALLRHYHALVPALEHHGEMYHLIHIDALNEYRRAKDAYRSRNSKEWTF